MMADAFKPCAIDGCNKNAHYKARGAKGWCKAHFSRWCRHGDPLGGHHPIRTADGKCKIEGCEDKLYGLGFCVTHHRRFKSTGDPLKVKIRRDWESDICSVGGCDKARHAHGLCVTHNRRRQVTGDPLVKSLHEHVDRRRRWIEENKAHEGDDCLIWPFGVNDNGRGTIQQNGKVMSAPRAMCMAAHGEPPAGDLHAAHSCGKGHEGCVNPLHLSWKTPLENERDKLAHGTLRKGEQINTNILTEDEVLEIKSRLPFERGADLAREFGVTRTCISNIKTGKSWKWLDLAEA